MSDLSPDTTCTNGDVFPITLFARVVQGSDGTFIVTLEPPKDGDDAPGVAVRPIPLIDEGRDLSARVGGALLREHGELHANTSLRTAPTFYGVTSLPVCATVYAMSGDGAPVPFEVPVQASSQPDDIISNEGAAQLTDAIDDATTEDLGEE
jgi:hypothetical protein